MDVWQEAAAAFDPWPTIGRQMSKVINPHVSSQKWQSAVSNIVIL